MPNIMSLGICLKNCTLSKLAHFLKFDTVSTLTLFSFERQKVHKKANLHEN